jgi:hypothetical protein
MLKISRAALVAAMLTLSAAPALYGSPVLAQETAGVTTSLSIPTITAVDSSMDEAALRDALSGGFMNHVSELASLSATSITIPEITFSVTMTSGAAAPVTNVASYKSVVLNNVRNGVAESASVEATTSTSPDGTVSLGRLSASALDIGGLLALYSLVPAGGPEQPMKVLYKDFSFEGGSFSGPRAECTLGKITAAEFSARPLKVSFAELMAASQTLQAATGSPPPEALATVVGFFTDIFQAFKSEPITMDGLNCTGKSETGEPFELAIGGVTIDGYLPGTYPALSVNDVKVGDGGKNSVTLDTATLKSIDLSGPIAALEAAGTKLNEAWFEANARALIPAFAGFSLAGLKADIDNPDKPGERLAASIGSFDLTLSNYVNGIPSSVATSATGIEVPLPSDPTDETSAMLKAMGIAGVNLGYAVDAAWDKAAQAINVNEVSISGVDLGSATIGATIGGASEQLFSLNPQLAIMASASLTLKTATLELSDAGFSDLVLAAAAKQQNLTPAAFRAQMGAGLEGLAIQILGSTDSARALGAAMSDFVSGSKKTLSITITAKNPAGVPLMQFVSQLGRADDPMALGPLLASLVDVTGSAR